MLEVIPFTAPEFYVYDISGRLQSIVKAMSASDGTNIYSMMYPRKIYIWDNSKVIAQIDKISNKTYYYIYNGHGDVVQIVDTSGNIVNQYDYDVWGNFITKEETIENHFTYFGQTYDETTGLYYLRARYYDPTTGRFTQQDPAEDGYNWYVYGNQNPVWFVDYSGLGPNDIFLTEEAAAEDFAKIYNPKSIKENAEYGAYIFSTVRVETKWGVRKAVMYYSYGVPVKGTKDSLNVEWFNIENGEITSIIHTHGAYKEKYANEKFSGEDVAVTKNHGLSKIYLVTPGGYLKVYSMKVGEGVTLLDNLPFDKNSPDKAWWRKRGGVER